MKKSDFRRYGFRSSLPPTAMWCRTVFSVGLYSSPLAWRGGAFYEIMQVYVSRCCLGYGIHSRCSVNSGWVCTTKFLTNTFGNILKGRRNIWKRILRDDWCLPWWILFSFVQNAKGGTLEIECTWPQHRDHSSQVPLRLFLSLPTDGCRCSTGFKTQPAPPLILLLSGHSHWPSLLEAPSPGYIPIHISSSTGPAELQILEVTKQMPPALGLPFFLFERNILTELRILNCGVLTAHFSLCYVYPRSQWTKGHLEVSSGFLRCFEEWSSARVMIGSEPRALSV